MGVLVKVSAKNLRMSAQKLNLVTAIIKKMKVSNALVQLAFCPKRVAIDVRKCLQSAVVKAENNMGLDIDSLVAISATVGKLFVIKRVRTRARGRSARIITVSEKEEN